jgi:hypothetical protein
MPLRSSARIAFAHSTSTTACSNSAAMSAFARASSAPPASRLRTIVSTAVLSPEKLIMRSPESIIGRGSDTAPARPDSASLASAGPPGYGRPSSVAVLSNASPAASSSVSPIIV